MVGGTAAASGTGASTSATAAPGGGGVFNTDSQDSSAATRSTTTAIAFGAVGARCGLWGRNVLRRAEVQKAQIITSQIKFHHDSFADEVHR